MITHFAHCYRSGEITISDQSDIDGCIQFANGSKEELADCFLVTARHAFDGETLLVPGLPEANSDEDAATALDAYAHRVNLSLNRAAQAHDETRHAD